VPDESLGAPDELRDEPFEFNGEPDEFRDASVEFRDAPFELRDAPFELLQTFAERKTCVIARYFSLQEGSLILFRIQNIFENIG